MVPLSPAARPMPDVLVLALLPQGEATPSAACEATVATLRAQGLAIQVVAIPTTDATGTLATAALQAAWTQALLTVPAPTPVVVEGVDPAIAQALSTRRLTRPLADRLTLFVAGETLPRFAFDRRGLPSAPATARIRWVERVQVPAALGFTLGRLARLATVPARDGVPPAGRAVDQTPHRHLALEHSTLPLPLRAAALLLGSRTPRRYSPWQRTRALEALLASGQWDPTAPSLPTDVTLDDDDREQLLRTLLQVTPRAILPHTGRWVTTLLTPSPEADAPAVVAALAELLPEAHELVGLRRQLAFRLGEVHQGPNRAVNTLFAQLHDLASVPAADRPALPPAWADLLGAWEAFLLRTRPTHRELVRAICTPTDLARPHPACAPMPQNRTLLQLTHPATLGDPQWLQAALPDLVPLTVAAVTSDDVYDEARSTQTQLLLQATIAQQGPLGVLAALPREGAAFGTPETWHRLILWEEALLTLSDALPPTDAAFAAWADAVGSGPYLTGTARVLNRVARVRPLPVSALEAAFRYHARGGRQALLLPLAWAVAVTPGATAGLTALADEMARRQIALSPSDQAEFAQILTARDHLATALAAWEAPSPGLPLQRG